MKTIEELVTALESGEYAKSKGQFLTTELDVRKDIADCVTYKIDPANANPPGYCCLGVYATINKMSFPRETAVFAWDGDDGLFISKPRLERDHWLIEKIHVADSFYRTTGYDVQFQSWLTDVNDDSETFEPVVRALKAFADGQRSFPSAENWVGKEEA